ncbi:PARP2-B [Symbiodinium microadriaticum]|nr:PARP2-B [Symbiodinium microadriaticum]
MASKGGQLRGSEPREHVNPSAAAALKPRVDPGGGRVRYRFLCHLRRPHLLGALSARRCRCTSCGKGLQLFRTFSSYVARPRRGAVSAVRRRWQRGGRARGAGSGSIGTILRRIEKARMRWGTEILTERPLLLARGRGYLRAADADPRLVEIAHAHRLGDGTRLAAYVAFRQPRPQQRKLVAASRIPVKQLQDHKQKEVLGFWRDGLEESDPLARAIHEENRLGIEAFLEDHPHFRKLIYWNHVVLVASIFGRFGLANPDGSRAIYRYCSHIRHSCRPNAAWFTLRHGYPKGKKKLHVIDLEGIRKRGEEITVSMVEGKLVIFFAAPRADLASRKAPENEHLIHVRIVWGDSSEWRAVDSMAWRRIIQSIEGELHSEELLLLRWLWLMMTCMLGLILGFMLGFLMSFLGCTDGNTGVCVTGLTFAGVFVCSLVCMVTGFFGLNVSVGRYGNAVFERIHVLVPQLAASNPNMKLDIINVQIGNGPAQFDLRVTLRKPGESVEPQEKIPQKPQVPTSPISADLVALPKALPTNWVNQDISAGDMFQMLLDQTFKAKSTRDRQGQLPRRLRVVKCHRVEDSALWSTYMTGLEGLRSKFPQGCTSIRDHYTADADAASPEAHGGSVATCEVLASLPVLDGKINEFYLLHGTSPGGALGITDGGFRLDFSGSHAGSMFGKGAYFSECSSKADEYSTDGEGIYEGVFAMILCRVACGELLRMLSATAGPDSRAVEQALAGKVLGDREASVGTYREFVVFDSTQIYPEYALWVRHFFRGFKEPLQAQQQRNRYGDDT